MTSIDPGGVTIGTFGAFAIAVGILILILILANGVVLKTILLIGKVLTAPVLLPLRLITELITPNGGARRLSWPEAALILMTGLQTLLQLVLMGTIPRELMSSISLGFCFCALLLGLRVPGMPWVLAGFGLIAATYQLFDAGRAAAAGAPVGFLAILLLAYFLGDLARRPIHRPLHFR